MLPSPALAGEGQGVRAYPWGDDWRPDHCNSKESGLGATSPVGIFPKGATSADLHDMVGNVYEWCRDWYGEDYYARSRDAHNPKGPDNGEYRVLRGASWYNEGPPYCRCGCRLWLLPRILGQPQGISLRQNPLLIILVLCPLSLVLCGERRQRMLRATDSAPRGSRRRNLVSPRNQVSWEQRINGWHAAREWTDGQRM